MQKAKILLSGKTNLQYYVDAVNNLGAEAIVKYLPKYDIDYDGLILCGGGDINPKYYNEPLDGSFEIDDARDESEFALLEAFITAKKPIFGICRGHQVINVYFGGSLYQHMPDSVLHTSSGKGDSVHNVTAAKGSILEKLYGTSFAVNSSHHQAIKVLGKGLVATAFWNEDYVEACEHENLPIFSVQWHPERMCFSKQRDDTVCGAKLIDCFIQMCKDSKD